MKISSSKSSLKVDKRNKYNWRKLVLRKVSARKNNGNEDSVQVGFKRLRYRALFFFFFSLMTLTISEVIDTNTPIAVCTVQDLDT